jgi:hypothetical protein
MFKFEEKNFSKETSEKTEKWKAERSCSCGWAAAH